MILRSIAAFAILTGAPSAPPVVTPSYDAQTVITPITDTSAEAKAPREDPKVVDLIEAVNAYVNNVIRPVSDAEHYGVDDLWVQYPRDGKGDCEDYSITKLGMLGQLGVPVVEDTKLVFVIVHEGKETDGHAILAVRLPHGTVLYLDNLNQELMTRDELRAQHYQFFGWRA